MPRWSYWIAPLLTVPALLAMVLGGPWTWVIPFITFAIAPALEFLLPADATNLSPDDQVRRGDDPLFTWLLRVMVPLQYLLGAAFLWRCATGGFAAWEAAGAVFTMGIACGVWGINVAHELGHRRSQLDQNLARALLLTSLYMHFFVEHNRGHHRRVATEDDPASARRGEWVHAFWLRSIVGAGAARGTSSGHASPATAAPPGRSTTSSSKTSSGRGRPWRWRRCGADSPPSPASCAPR